MERIVFQYWFPHKRGFFSDEKFSAETPRQFEEVSRLTEKLQEAFEPVYEEFPGVDISISVSNTEGYRVNFEGDGPVDEAAEEFMKIAGIPSFVGGSAVPVEVIEPFFNTRGYKSKRRFYGALVGKHIVPKLEE